MHATQNQIKAIYYHLWKAEAKWSPSIGKQIEELDMGTASDVINAFKEGNKEIAVAQLNHLGINV